MRRAARVDANQPEIIQALQQVGATVLLTHMLGQGAPDLAVGYRGVNYWLEVKDGAKPPSKRKLTPDEAVWHEVWRGDVRVVNSVDEALQVIGAI
jgi:hypothetical protein